jgi:hypothetical protein
MIKILEDQDDPSWDSAAYIMGEMRDERAIMPLINALENRPSKRDWKYVNVDLFHILESMVRQQDTSAISHIRKARDFFPDIYVDYKICQIAMGRIKKGHVDGFLPLEYLDIAMPTRAIMNMLSGGELGYEDTFEENYGEYFEDDDDEVDETEVKATKKKTKSKSSTKRKTKTKSKGT